MDPDAGLKLATVMSVIEILVVPIVIGILWCIRDLYDRYVKTLTELANFRTEVAEKYATHETMERTESKLLTEFRNLSSKLDRIIERQGVASGHD